MIRQNRIRIDLCLKVILAVFIPFIISSIFVYIDGGECITGIMPSWNDEDFYYHQIKAILEYGQPLGYYGYDGSNARIGNFGFHGFIILLPYVMFATVLGFEYYTMAVVNISLLSITNVIYLYLYKPDIKKLLFFSTISFSPMVLFYTNTCMVEGLNYFFAILSAILMKYSIDNKENKKIKWVTLFVIVWATLSKVTWSVLAFPYCLIFLCKSKWNRYIQYLFSSLFTVLFTVAGYMCFILFRADYFIGSSMIDYYMECFNAFGILNALKLISKQIYNNISMTWLVLQVPWLEICRLYILIALFIAVIYKFINKKEQRFFEIPIIIMGGFIIGVAFLYAGGGPAIRTIYSSAVFSMTFFIINILNGKKFISNYIYYSVCFLFVITGFFLQVRRSWPIRDYYQNMNEDYYESIKEYMANIELDIDSQDPWRNTLALSMDSYPDRIYELHIPIGTGINCYADISKNSKGISAEYILLKADYKDLETLLINGYRIIDNDKMTVLLRKHKVKSMEN